MTEKKCDCIFCHSKCPECGSINIDVEFKLSYEYSNGAQDVIAMHWRDSGIEIKCRDCGETYRHDDWERDERLEPLHAAIAGHLQLPPTVLVPIDDH